MSYVVVVFVFNGSRGEVVVRSVECCRIVVHQCFAFYKNIAISENMNTIKFSTVITKYCFISYFERRKHK